MTADADADCRGRVRVIVVNYHGGDMTLDCLRSLAATRWPAGDLEVVLVDNGSEPGFDDAVAAALPGVRYRRAARNLGFGGACNLALDDLGDVDYVALVNNDAMVPPGWLAPLVSRLAADEKLGAACPKILFANPFVDVEVRSATSGPGPFGRRRRGVEVTGVRNADGTPIDPQFVSGFWPPERGGAIWSAGDALLRIPAPGGTAPAAVRLRLRAESPRQVRCSSGQAATSFPVTATASWYHVPLAATPADIVNNAGNIVTADLHGADRGFLEVDAGHYDRPDEVFAWCGAAVVLSARYLEDVGRFDPSLFLYYEDLELSWRGRRRGWRYGYEPASVVRHRHSATTGGDRRQTVLLNERNRLLVVSRHAPAGVAGRTVLRHLVSTLGYLRQDVVAAPFARRMPTVETVGIRLAAFGAFLRRLPRTLLLRARERLALGPALLPPVEVCAGEDGRASVLRRHREEAE